MDRHVGAPFTAEARPTVSARPSVTVALMGVSGAGKSTVLKVLVERLGWPSAEADDFHFAANVVKMSLAAESARPAP